VGAALHGTSAALLLMAVGLFYLPGVLWGFAMGTFGIAAFLAQVATVTVAFFATKPIKRPELRLLLRALALAVAFTPFIPHAGVEWTMPFPPAGFSILTGTSDFFELSAIAGFTALIWLALHAFYRNWVRKRPTDEDSPWGQKRPAPTPQSVAIVEDAVLGMFLLAVVVVVVGRPIFLTVFR
jgi:hypothetical protein